MVRADVDRIEVQRERQHHHGVLRARRERDDDVGQPERQERHDEQREAGRDDGRDRERTRAPRRDSRAASAGWYWRSASPRPRPRVTIAALPSHHGSVRGEQARAVQDRRCGQRAEHQPAGKPHPLQDRRHRGRHHEQDREFAERSRRRDSASPDRPSSPRAPARPAGRSRSAAPASPAPRRCRAGRR